MKIGQEVYVVQPVYSKTTVVNVDEENIYVDFFGQVFAFDKTTKFAESCSNKLGILCANLDDVKRIQNHLFDTNNTKLLL